MWLFVDIGSSFIKHVIVDGGRCGRWSVTQTPGNISPVSGRYEIDAEQLFQVFRKCLEDSDAADMEGVLLSTQMHGCVATDPDGWPVTHLITWQDRASLTVIQGETTLAWAARRLCGDALFRAGVPLKANLGLASLAARVREGSFSPRGTLFHTLGGYLMYRLCGSHTCHLTNAAPCGIADVQSGTLNRDMIRAFGLEEMTFPRLETGFRPCGSLSMNGASIPVYPDIGDQQVCLAGTGCRLETDLHVNVGTAGLMGMLSVQYQPGAYENRAWLDAGTYLRTVSGLPGGRTVDALHSQLTQKGMSVQEAWSFLTTVQGTPVPLVWLGDELLPERPDGLQDEDWCVSVYAAMAEQYHRAAEQMGCQAQFLRFTGGCILKNKALQAQVLARFPGSDYGLYDIDLGAAALAKRAAAFESPADSCKSANC